MMKPAADESTSSLVLLQAFDGAWEASANLIKILGAVAAAAAPASIEPRVWATALALAYLHLHASCRKSEWQLVANKATAWLQRVGVTDPDALVAQARNAMSK